MGDERATPVVEDGKENIREILREIDLLAEVQGGRWAEKRAKGRRKYQTAIEALYPSPDGTSTLTISGTTRDISLGGLGFVSPEHFMRKTPLRITIALAPDKIRHLAGRVVYSRRVGEGWYLTGVRFGPVDDSAFTPKAPATATAPGSAAASPPTERGEGAKRETGRASTGSREQALAVLAAAGAARNMSKDLIIRVVTMSMSSDHVVRRAAIPVLMQIPGQDGVLAIIERLNNDPNPTVQAEAAAALGALQATQAIDDLRRCLRHANLELRLRAAEALGRMGNKSGLGVVARILREDGPLSRRAARALGMIVGQPFRANAGGVAAARNYIKTHRIR